MLLNCSHHQVIVETEWKKVSSPWCSAAILVMYLWRHSALRDSSPAQMLIFAFPQPPLEELGVGVGPDAQEVWVTRRLVEHCTPLVEKMNHTTGDRQKYKYEIER